ncbi:MAG TPA: mannose-1-phosphate guanylyltransferase, partial [Rhizomicrobium sp.]|nr:mannose-1-phosphate guanylyltransferase [Rhizomicrobium sp.]
MSKSLFIPVILSGGSGTRLWPLSRVSLPKQLLALGGERTMIQDTALRVGGATSEQPIVICSEAHRFLVAQQMQECGVSPRAIVLEPEGRNTAPAAAIAALLASEADPTAVIALLPSDHRVANTVAFQAALSKAIEAAEEGWVVTFGISPSAPETGYGYIEQGDALPNSASLHKVLRFVEKPDAKTAQSYLAHGGYTWNSGMFVFRADILLAELGQYCPDIVEAARQTLA